MTVAQERFDFKYNLSSFEMKKVFSDFKSEN